MGDEGGTVSFIYAHLIGDFLLQTHEMSVEKKRSSVFCGFHVVCYMVPFLLCGFAWWQLALVAAQHYAQDRGGFVVWLMKAKGRGSVGFTEPPFAPWSIIVMDNILHILWIALVAWMPEVLP